MVLVESVVFKKKRDCTIYVAKTKALISCEVTAYLICAFAFAYTKGRFSHDAAHLVILAMPYNLLCFSSPGSEGELIEYPSSQRPSVRACILPSVCPHFQTLISMKPAGGRLQSNFI